MFSFKFLLIVAMIVMAMILALTAVEASGGPGENANNREADKVKSEMVKRGRYLVEIGGCNDCHTPGYMEVAGDLPQKEWLVGSSVGFRGPWGVTYPINLRLLANKLTSDEWAQQVKTVKAAPPMPWWALHAMTNKDVRSIYAFLRYLGPAGEEAPSAIGPDKEPETPWIDFMPHFPKGMSYAR